MKATICGEGPTEVGDWARAPEYRRDPPRRGLLQVFLQRFVADAEVADGLCWKDIKKFRAGQHRGAEARNVLGLALRASARKHSLAVFLRDRDGDVAREAAIRAAVVEAEREFPDVRVVGGAPVEASESWLLSLQGERRAEERSDPKSELATKHGVTDSEAKALLAEKGLATLDDTPADATSLHAFIAALQLVAGEPAADL